MGDGIVAETAEDGVDSCRLGSGTKRDGGGAGELQCLDVGGTSEGQIGNRAGRCNLKCIAARAAADCVRGELRCSRYIEGVATTATDEIESAIVGVELDKGIIADAAEDGID